MIINLKIDFLAELLQIHYDFHCLIPTTKQPVNIFLSRGTNGYYHFLKIIPNCNAVTY